MAYQDEMRRQDKARTGIPLGGIGTGGFELRKDGIFHNWHIFNNYPFATGAPFPFPHDSLLFFVVRYQVEGEHPRLKLLQIEEGYQVAAIPNHAYIFPWISGVDRIEYAASFPFARLRYTDADMPFDIELEAFSPFIPQDVKNSSLPAAIFNFTITAHTQKPVDVMLMASQRFGGGYDVAHKTCQVSVEAAPGCQRFQMLTGEMDKTHSSYGSQALLSLGDGTLSYYTGWEHVHPYYEIVLRNLSLPNLDDTPGRHLPDKETGKSQVMERIFGTLAASHRLTGSRHFQHTFISAWHFPNLYAEQRLGEEKRLEGNYYANFFADAVGVAAYVKDNLADLDRRTRRFHDSFYASSVESWLLDEINSQLTTFVTSAWLTRAGEFGIQEGLTPTQEWGPLASIDVAMYGSFPTALFFPELDQAMLKAHRRMQAEWGQTGHGITRHFNRSDLGDREKGRLDLPTHYAVQVMRNALWTGDRAFLEELWSSVKAALEYLVRERDQNGDGVPDMTGIMCTYDNLPMHGIAAYIAGEWIAALSYATRCAEILGDDAAAARYAAMRLRAQAAFETRLWNGEYYRLYNDLGGPHGRLNEGCFTDQLFGQWLTRQVGLGDIADPERMESALRAILKRSLDAELGLRNCRWDDDGWLHDVPPPDWVDTYNTAWTGVELAFAALLIYQGMAAEGFQVARAVYARYLKLGLHFDHQEFGGHYYRAMSAWSIVNALLGLSICNGVVRFAPQLDEERLRLFFVTPSATAFYAQDAVAGKISLEIISGRFTCRELVIAFPTGSHNAVTVNLNDVTWRQFCQADEIRLQFSDELSIPEGQTLTIQLV